MNDLPLYSVEMRKLRGALSIVKFARACGVSRETVRLVEKGKLRPSSDLLAKWLRQAGTTVEERPDIVSSLVLAKQKSRSAQELATLKTVNGGEASIDRCLQEIMAIIKDGGYLPEEALVYKQHQIALVLKEHHG